jgi:hypothetical protein
MGDQIVRKQEQRRNKQFNIGLTEGELSKLHTRASTAGMRAVDYARARLFGGKTVERSTDAPAHNLDPLFLPQLSRLGNNLNQIVRKLHQLDLPAPPTLEPLLQEIRDLIRKVTSRGS